MKISHIAAGLLLVALSVSCAKDPDFEPVNGSSGSSTQPGRLPSEETRQVMIMYSAGFNSLSGELSIDLSELEEGYVPTAQSRSDHILLVFSRQTKTNYSNPQAPVLYRLYKDRAGEVVRDTLLRWQPEDQACDPKVLEEVMRFAKEKFPAKGYGLVLSSHGLGWMPDKRDTRAALKSVGQDADSGKELEMEIHEFVKALPYKLEYVLLDACFMGCVEVAWALRNKAHYVGFSPTEIMSDGFNYLTLGERLLASEPDALAVCQDYFAQYAEKPSERDQNATITLVDASAMEPLAIVCESLFEKYREPIAALKYNQVQRYYRYGMNVRHEHFFDLRHMLQQAGVSATEMAMFDTALQGCVLYEAHTAKFISIPLDHVCGLSVFLPSSGTESLKTFYKTYVDWNDATKLLN